MSRMGRHTRFTYAASLTWGQARVILSLYWRQCLLGAFVFAGISILSSLSEPARYQSVAVLKVKTFDISRSLNAEQLKDGDAASGREVVDRQARLAASGEFGEELARVVSEDPERTQLRLSWGVGDRFRLALALGRLGMGDADLPAISTDTLTPNELAALFGSMADIRSNYLEASIEIRVQSLHRETAIKVANYMGQALVRASSRNERAEIGKSLEFLRDQKDKLRHRLVDSEESLKQFYRENPGLASETARRSITEDANSLGDELKKKTDELLASKRLLEFYKKRFSSFMKNSDTTTEVYDKFKQELVELKYRRKKFIFQGYSESHEGIREIDEKIAMAEKVLNSAGDLTGRNVVSVQNEGQLSEKIVTLQDTIKKIEIDIDGTNKRKAEADARSKVLPEKEMLHTDFQRDVRISREIFDDVSRRLELAEVRASNAHGVLSLLTAVSAALVHRLPAGKKVFFFALMGFVLTAAASVLLAVARKLIVDELNVLEMGFKFAGNLRPSNSDRAKVLLNLGCDYRPEKTGDPTIVLCSSPKGDAGAAQVLLLTEHLARQREKSLFIIVGSLDISRHFTLRSDLEYARVYTSADGGQFILQISDEETVYSIRECLAIVEAQYRVKYSMIFLYFQEGDECLVYAYGQQLASKMLLIGPKAGCTSAEYFRLVDGFQNLDEVYVALTETKRGRFARAPKPAQGAHA